MKIARAAPTDALLLSTIAYRAKAHWGYPLPWLEQWRAQLTITPEFLVGHETFVAELDRQVVGFYALTGDADAMHLEHLWVLPEAMHRGIGTALFRHAAQNARDLGASCLRIESDPNAEPFYAHMGAVRVGVVASEIEGIRRELPMLELPLT